MEAVERLPAQKREECRFLSGEEAVFIDLTLWDPLEAEEDGAAAGLGGFATGDDLAFLEDRLSDKATIGLLAVLVREARP